MAKRKEQRAHNASPVTRSDVVTPDQEWGRKQFLVFHCAEAAFAFRLDEVGEVLRLPRLIHMPLGPRSLMGLTNLRGIVLPVVSLAILLGIPTRAASDSSRVIVIGGAAPVGFAVDRIDNLIALPMDDLENVDTGAGSIDPDLLEGVVKGDEGRDAIKILSPTRLLRSEFSQIGVRGGRRPTTAGAAIAPVTTEKQEFVSLVSFELQEQEYGVPLERVREIIPLPTHISEIPRAETAVLGVVTLRDHLLPIVSLRALLGLPSNAAPEERGKVVVLSMGRGSIGIVADRTREILHVDSKSIDPAPALLTRGDGDAEITSICRLDSGKRLVALLSPDRLFRSDLMSRVILEQHQDGDISAGEPDGSTMADAQFVIFQLGGQEYGLPIDAVREIARPPEFIAKLPKAPPFVDGIMSLRGFVLPIVDLRRRFELSTAEDSKERRSGLRILVLALQGGQTGFMVDSVSEVLKVPSEAIQPAPDLSPDQMRLIGHVANLEQQGRMILLVDPAQLLNQIESDLLANFDRTASHASKAS